MTMSAAFIRFMLSAFAAIIIASYLYSAGNEIIAQILAAFPKY